MADMTCEYVVNSRYRDFYDLNDEHSLNAFHAWLAKRISNELEKKYGLRNIFLTRQDIWEDDFGLIAECDFHELDDGSLRVTFSREPYPNWDIIRDGDVILRPDNDGLEVNLQQALARAALANAI